MQRTTLSFLLILTAISVSGCTMFTPSDRGFGSKPLEIPPDLTTPNTESASRVPNTGTPVSAQSIREFELFQSRLQLADYQDFLLWRKTHSIDEEQNISAFKEFKKNQANATLLRDGVLLVVNDLDYEILLISDSLDNSWNRVDTALINLNLQLLDRNKITRVFRISYNTGRRGGANRGWRNWATRLTGRTIYQLKLREEEGIVVAALYNRENKPIGSAAAKPFLRRLASQLKTFAGKTEQFVTGGIQPLPGLMLQKQSSGQMKLIIPKDPETAWKRVYRALRDTNFSLESYDDDDLNFWIRYAGSDRKITRNFLYRLGLRKKKDLQIINHYRIQLTGVFIGNETTVTVWDSEARPTVDVGEDILSMLFERLKN